MDKNIYKEKGIKKRIERWFGRQWVNLILNISRFLTLSRARTLGRILGNTGYYVIVRHRRAAVRNLNLIYSKEKSPGEIKQMARQSFIYASCFGWELLYQYTRHLAGKMPEKQKENIEGLEHLQTAASRGRGVIGIGAHLGNFVLLGGKLAALGFANTTIMRQMKDGKLENMFDTMRVNLGQKWIPKLPVSRAIKESIAWLRAGKLLMIYMDQRSGSGVNVDFMGILTPTPTGAAVFALKTDAAVLPIVNVLDGENGYKLIIGEEIPVTRTTNHKKDIEENTARFSKAIEKYILLYPDQWFWFHNRWKGITPANEIA